MKTKAKYIVLPLLIVSLIFTGIIIAFADQENEFEIPHNHEYTAIGFSNGEVTLKCDICDDEITVQFADHINEVGYEPLDVVPDGIINAKDFAYLNKAFN